MSAGIGVCPACKCAVRLMLDGTIGGHSRWPLKACPGIGKPPVVTATPALPQPAAETRYAVQDTMPNTPTTIPAATMAVDLVSFLQALHHRDGSEASFDLSDVTPAARNAALAKALTGALHRILDDRVQPAVADAVHREFSQYVRGLLAVEAP